MVRNSYSSGRNDDRLAAPNGKNVPQAFVGEGEEGEKLSDVLPCHPYSAVGNMNLNAMLVENIRSHDYFKGLSELTTFDEVVDQIYYDCSYVTPWRPGTHKAQRAAGMCSGLRGVRCARPRSQRRCPLCRCHAAPRAACRPSTARPHPSCPPPDSNAGLPSTAYMLLFKLYCLQVRRPPSSLGSTRLRMPLPVVLLLGGWGPSPRRVVATAASTPAPDLHPFSPPPRYAFPQLTRGQINRLLNHKDSPYIRAIGFLYLRYVCEPKQLLPWLNPYLDDPEPISELGAGGEVTSVGRFVRKILTELVRCPLQQPPLLYRGRSAGRRFSTPPHTLLSPPPPVHIRPHTFHDGWINASEALSPLTRQEYHDTMLPRLPVPVARDIERQLADRGVPFQPAWAPDEEAPRDDRPMDSFAGQPPLPEEDRPPLRSYHDLGAVGGGKEMDRAADRRDYEKRGEGGAPWGGGRNIAGRTAAVVAKALHPHPCWRPVLDGPLSLCVRGGASPHRASRTPTTSTPPCPPRLDSTLPCARYIASPSIPPLQMRSGATAPATTGAGTSADTRGGAATQGAEDTREEGTAEEGATRVRWAAAVLRPGRSGGTSGVGGEDVPRPTGDTTGRGRTGGRRGAAPSRRRSRIRNGNGWTRPLPPSKGAGPSQRLSPCRRARQRPRRRRPRRSWRGSAPCRPRGPGCTAGASGETTHRDETAFASLPPPQITRG
jgi:hypothetical protein